MKLKRWIISKGMTITEFSKLIKIPYMSIYKYCNGARPNALNAAKISRFTNHEVTQTDLGFDYIKSNKTFL